MRFRHILAAAVTGIMIACLGPGTAHAVSVLADYGRYPIPYPIAVLADGAVWTAASSSGELDLVRGEVGRPARVVQRLGADPDYGGTRLFVPRLSATEGRVAFSLGGGVDGDKGTSGYVKLTSATVVGLQSGTTSRLRTCPGGQLDTAIAGSWLVVAGCGGDLPGPVDAFDLRNPGRPPVRLAATGSSVRAEGRMVAIRVPGQIVVRDVVTRAEVSRIQTTLPLDPDDWDVQADGKVAAVLEDPARPSGYPRRIVWFSVGSPATPTVVNTGGAVYRLRLAGDRLVFERPDAGFGRSALIVRSLSGDEKVVARYLTGGAFDFDETHAAWIRTRCDGEQVVFGTVDGQPTNTQRISYCPLALDRGDYDEEITPVITRRGRFYLGARCQRLLPPRRTDRCKISARLTSRGRTYAKRRFSVRAGRDFEIRLDGGRRLWRLGPSGSVMLRVTMTMRGHTRRTRTPLLPLYSDSLQ